MGGFVKTAHELTVICAQAADVAAWQSSAQSRAQAFAKELWIGVHHAQDTGLAHPLYAYPGAV